MIKFSHFIFASCLSAVPLFNSTAVLAIGDGIIFEVDEYQIPTSDNIVAAESLDFTYHACSRITGKKKRRAFEHGYFSISSFQDNDRVVNSQINHVRINSYQIYGKYSYRAKQEGPIQRTATGGGRRNYLINPDDATILLYVDPLRDTHLQIRNCNVVTTGNNDDLILGVSHNVIVGEKSETSGLADGDFKVVFNNWEWGQFAYELINPAEPFDLDDFNFLVFNGNITDLGGPLNGNHAPEGAGNLFWL